MRRKPWRALAEPVYRAMEAALSDRRLKRIAELMEPDPAKDSPEGRELDLLVDEQIAYEKRVSPLTDPNGIPPYRR